MAKNGNPPTGTSDITRLWPISPDLVDRIRHLPAEDVEYLEKTILNYLNWLDTKEVDDVGSESLCEAEVLPFRRNGHRATGEAG